MINFIFWIVERILYYTSLLLHLTYNEINIIVYYGLIPLSWCYMLDRIVGWQIMRDMFVPWLSLIWSAIWLCLIVTLNRRFSKFCDWAFTQSVDFLNYFNRWGGNYVLNSVIICVAIPLLVYIALTSIILAKE